jgi:flavin-dependent dehydrogenase
MYDAIVVGARCAGSPTAMLLARMGYRVLLLDQASFPSDTISSHYIHQPGVACLKRWGVLEKVVDSNAPAVRQLTFDVGPFALRGAPVAENGVEEGYAPRRTVLDKILVDAAVEAGAEVRERFSVDDVLAEDGRVTGIRGHADGGAAVKEQARLVIGADGRNSLIARRVQAPTYQTKPAHTCAYYGYWTGVPLVGAELYVRPGRMIILSPTNDGQTLIQVFWPHAAFHDVRANIEGAFFQTLDLVPNLAARVRSGKRTERFRGTADLPFFFRTPSGPGWALVGDAGYHKDPITAQGISDAFRDAERLTEAIDDGLTGRRPLEQALACYEEARNAAVMPIYDFTATLATLEPPSIEMQQLFGALRDNPAQTSRFFGTIVGTVPIPEFFSPDNLRRILGTGVQNLVG